MREHRVDALDNSESLSILNIDEDLLDSPTTTLEYLERCRAWTQLRNIAKSIPDLLNQSPSLPTYVRHGARKELE